MYVISATTSEPIALILVEQHLVGNEAGLNLFILLPDQVLMTHTAREETGIRDAQRFGRGRHGHTSCTGDRRFDMLVDLLDLCRIV
jgi:hypothetical protein